MDASLPPALARHRLAGPAAVFVLFFAGFAWLFVRFPVLYDTDSYYHLAIARAYAEEGLFTELRWARFSLMREGFGDKEFLFHVLLVPFAAFPDPAFGGRLALALLNALLAAALAALGQAAAGRWGLAVPFLVYGGSLAFVERAIRLRPELLALLLLLLATWAASRGRYRLLALTSGLYALAYTAFHALAGLALAWFLYEGWWRRRWEWRLLLYPLLGLGLGLVFHPGFPDNLVVWKVQSIDYFQLKDVLDVGPEIHPPSADQVLWGHLGWWLALVALWFAARPAGGPATVAARSETPEPAGLLGVNTAAYGFLYLLMLRFSTYFVPFATLALLFELRRRGQVVGQWVALPGRGRLPLALALTVALATTVPKSAALLHGLAEAGGGAPLTREEEWAAFGRAVPEGARIAAEWGSTHLYLYWAPQALYLNVLDPVFMAVAFPGAFHLQQELFAGREPDVPLALAAGLASDHLAFSSFHRAPELALRLATDPRVRPLHQGYTQLFQVVPEANHAFVLDWRVVPRGSELPPRPDAPLASWDAYPRASDPLARAVEGYVDATRVAAPPACLGLVHELAENVTETLAVYEFAPYGAATLWLDGDLVVTSGGSPGAFLGRGLTLPLHLGPGSHRLTVLTCPAGGEPRSGFYLRRIKDRTPPHVARADP